MMRYKDLADVKAFDELFLRYQGKIYGYLYSRVSDKALCDDVFQNTFLKLHKNKRKFSDKYPFSPWLFTICRNAMIDAFRKQGRQEIPSDEVDRLSQQVEEAPPRHTIPDEVIDALPDNQQKAIRLRYFKEYSFEKIADELNTSAHNARQLVSRGIKKIKFILAERGERNE